MRKGLSPLGGSAATEAVARRLATPPRNVRRWISALGLTRARASGVTDDQVGHRHSGPKPPDELVRVELDADRIALECRRAHPGLTLLCGREVIDEELDAVAVGIAVVQGRGRPVVDGVERPDAPPGEPHVVFQQLAHRAEGERDMMDARRVGGRHGHVRVTVARDEGTEVDERHPMMLVVVGHEPRDACPRTRRGLRERRSTSPASPSSDWSGTQHVTAWSAAWFVLHQCSGKRCLVVGPLSLWRVVVRAAVAGILTTPTVAGSANPPVREAGPGARK